MRSTNRAKEIDQRCIIDVTREEGRRCVAGGDVALNHFHDVDMIFTPKRRVKIKTLLDVGVTGSKARDVHNNHGIDVFSIVDLRVHVAELIEFPLNEGKQ